MNSWMCLLSKTLSEVVGFVFFLFFAFWVASLENTFKAVFAIKVKVGLRYLHLCAKNKKKKNILKIRALELLELFFMDYSFFFEFVFFFFYFLACLHSNCLPANYKTKPLLLLVAHRGDMVAAGLRYHKVSNKALIKTLSIISVACNKSCRGNSSAM